MDEGRAGCWVDSSEGVETVIIYATIGLLFCLFVLWAYERDRKATGKSPAVDTPFKWFLLCGGIIWLWPLALAHVLWVGVTKRGEEQ